MMDRFIFSLDRAVRTLSGAARGTRVSPYDNDAGKSTASTRQEKTVRENTVLTSEEKTQSIELMRVNHAGEVAAQALYDGQALFSRDPALATKLKHAADEEIDHLTWTRERIQALGGRTSALDPLWYAGAFAIGAAAAAVGDKVSLSFLEATERQVEAHLASHLDRLPTNDLESRAIVEQMKADEASHAQTARELGASPMPFVAQKAMSLAAKVMTTVAAKI
ncbi:MAG: 2-polyprenyl-3-methyl-6-methoxy-1,4-benzoquinone monooxygenase [Casimicrobium sp.]